MKRYFRNAMAGLALLGLAACKKGEPGLVQGYVEGEFVHVAAPLGGQLRALYVKQGAHVGVEDALFSLDDTEEKAARDEAAMRVNQARANLEDLKMGARDSEVAAIVAGQQGAKAALELAVSEEARQLALFARRATSAELKEQAVNQRKSAEQAVAQVAAELETAGLGGRKNLLVAAGSEIAARQAALRKAQWQLDQKFQKSPVAGVVTDTVFRQGDWVAGGNSVVVILPSENLKVRAFVPQEELGGIEIGDEAAVRVDGVAQPFTGKVTFISPRAEYTPPVIYSKEMREKYVFLVELGFAKDDLTKLHPGQPVDVKFPQIKE